MICYVDKSLNSFFVDLSINDPFLCKIKSLYNAYSYDTNGVDFYIQFNIKKDITAVISKIDQTAVCYIEAYADFEELSDFLRIIEVKTVTLNQRYINKISHKDSLEGYIMRLEKLISPSDIDKEFLIKVPLVKELLDFLVYNFDYRLTCDQYDNMYVDLSHRLRHNSIKAIAAFYNGHIIGSAMIIAFTKETAVLGCVATDLKYRRNCIASFLICEILKDYIGKKDVYLFREQNKNEEFYRNLGFDNQEKWAEIEI